MFQNCHLNVVYYSTLNRVHYTVFTLGNTLELPIKVHWTSDFYNPMFDQRCDRWINLSQHNKSKKFKKLFWAFGHKFSSTSQYISTLFMHLGKIILAWRIQGWYSRGDENHLYCNPPMKNTSATSFWSRVYCIEDAFLSFGDFLDYLCTGIVLILY
jgi:hypothetical protein